MRYLALFALPLVLAAQPADGDKVTQALISEIQQLRMAIERSTLLNARTQLAVSQLQMQENAVVRLQSQLNDVRGRLAGTTGHRTELASAVQRFEDKRTAPEYTSGSQKEAIDAQIKQIKLEFEQAGAMQVSLSAQEGELAAQLQAAQTQASDSRSRIAEMERALDAAIQQMLRPK